MPSESEEDNTIKESGLHSFVVDVSFVQAHGTFRPAIQRKERQNEEETVRDRFSGIYNVVSGPFSKDMFRIVKFSDG